MKKFFIIAITLLIALTVFSACSGKKENSGASSEGNLSSGEKTTAAASAGSSGSWSDDIDWGQYGLSGIAKPKGTELGYYHESYDGLSADISNCTKDSFTAIQSSIEKLIGKQKEVIADDADHKGYIYNYEYTFEYQRTKAELSLHWYPNGKSLSIRVEVIESFLLPEVFNLEYIGLSEIKAPKGVKIESFSVSDDHIYGKFDDCNNETLNSFQTVIQTAIEKLNGKLRWVDDKPETKFYEWNYTYSEMEIRLTLWYSKKDEDLTINATLKNFPSELKEVWMTGLSGTFSSFELNSNIYHHFGYDPGVGRGRFRIEWDDSACGDEIEVSVFGPYGGMSHQLGEKSGKTDKLNYLEYISSSYTPNQNAVCSISVLYKRSIDDSMRRRKAKDYISGTYTMRVIKIND